MWDDTIRSGISRVITRKISHSGCPDEREHDVFTSRIEENIFNKFLLPHPSYRSLLFLYCRQLEQEPARGITRAEIIATSSHSSARPDEITRSLETWTVNAAINYRARGDRASMCALPPPLSPCPPPLPSPLSSIIPFRSSLDRRVPNSFYVARDQSY